jgi:hypothetical protein
MGESVLIGRGREIVEVPWQEWEQGLAGRVPLIQARLGFMSPEHHLVRNFAVRELPRQGIPMPPEFIGGKLGLPRQRVVGIIEELEKNLTFLYRNKVGGVAWAYPVTVDKTPHVVAFSTGEKLFAA